MSRILFACFALLAMSVSARAEETASLSCSYTDTNGDVYETSFRYDSRSVSSRLLLNGVEIPSVHSCMTWAHGNPRMGGKWRCPHGMAEIRFEVYPILPGNFGNKPPKAFIIRWNGDQLFATIEAKDCR